MKVARHFSGGLAFSEKRCVPGRDDRAPFVSLSQQNKKRREQSACGCFFCAIRLPQIDVRNKTGNV
jgi:hypothetical protein